MRRCAGQPTSATAFDLIVAPQSCVRFQQPFHLARLLGTPIEAASARAG
jgi:hypothetical protein